MLTASRSLKLSSQSSPKLPEVPALDALYRLGCTPRQGEVIMIAGRSGTGKSSFALWWVAQMNLPTLYFSADMSAYQASIRLGCSVTGLTMDEIEERMAGNGRAAREIESKLNKINMIFKFGEITWRGIDDALNAWVELWNEFPKVIVIDNLMDIAGAESDYSVQMEAMQILNDLSRETGATVIILHHATDKGWDARSDPYRPPSRDQVKGGLSEKPALSLSVAYDPTNSAYHIAVIKQRMGASDPTGSKYATLLASLGTTQFLPWRGEYREVITAPGSQGQLPTIRN